MRKRQTFMIIVDHDRKEFTVHGPLADDSALTEAVFRAQEGGRSINCHTCPADMNRDKLIADFSRQQQFNYVDDALV